MILYPSFIEAALGAITYNFSEMYGFRSTDIEVLHLSVREVFGPELLMLAYLNKGFGFTDEEFPPLKKKVREACRKRVKQSRSTQTDRAKTRKG